MRYFYFPKKGVGVMFEISEIGDIKLTRSDTAKLIINLELEDANGDRVPYGIASDTIVKFTVKKDYNDDPVIEKIVTGTTEIHIEPLDTTNLDFGKYK
jgi:hypothetical protein